MPVELIHTTLGVTFLAVLAVIGQIVVGDSRGNASVDPLSLKHPRRGEPPLPKRDL